MNIVPAVYTPWTSGTYDVAPGLKALGTDFGNGLADQRHFQIDNQFARYHVNKKWLANERPNQHVLRDRLDETAESVIAQAIAQILCVEHPDYFGLHGNTLTCHLTESRCALDSPFALNEIAFMMQEDLAILKREGDADWLAYLNVCAPSDWAPESKIGGSFFQTHLPIPGFERTNSVAPKMVDAMIQKGPFVRFVWAAVSDEELNHHPNAFSLAGTKVNPGREFSRGRFWIRTERQVTWGFPKLDAALFTIRVGFMPDHVILANPMLTATLRQALLGMSEPARKYKGISEEFDALVALLAV